MSTEKNYIETLKKRNRLLAILFSISLLALLYLFYLLEFPNGGHKFVDSLDEETAINNVATVRKWPRSTGNSSKGVWYDTADIRKYITDTFPESLKKLSLDGSGKAPDGYEWKVGFYWMMTKDKTDDKNKRDFCVMPVLVSKTTTDSKREVVDYFDDKDEKMYKHPKLVTGQTVKGSAYDNGQMWP